MAGQGAVNSVALFASLVYLFSTLSLYEYIDVIYCNEAYNITAYIHVPAHTHTDTHTRLESLKCDTGFQAVS